ncbi:hypothetical protein J3F83DRAFT_639917 [Trichoderma novae-zelandiae]
MTDSTDTSTNTQRPILPELAFVEEPLGIDTQNGRLPGVDEPEANGTSTSTKSSTVVSERAFAKEPPDGDSQDGLLPEVAEPEADEPEADGNSSSMERPTLLPELAFVEELLDADSQDGLLPEVDESDMDEPEVDGLQVDEPDADEPEANVPGGASTPPHGTSEADVLELSTDDTQSNGPKEDESTTTSSSQGPSPVKWVIGWRFPVLVTSLFVAGTLIAIGHHIFYQTLENTPVKSSSQQVWAIRIGSGLAFLNKTCLTAVMGMVATQQIWFTVRRRVITLSGIDSMFKLMNDPTAVFSRDLVTRAKTLVLLASLSWLIPLIAVVTPATLSVRTSMESSVISAVVPAVDFNDHSYWALRMDGVWEPSGDLQRLFTATYSSVSYLPIEAPFPNSSYEVSFWATTLKCSSLDDFVAQQETLHWLDYPGEEAARIDWDRAEISVEWEWNDSMANPGNAAYTSWLPQDPINNMWANVIFVWAAGTTSGIDNDANTVCQVYNTSIEISVRFDNGVQSIIPLSHSYLHPQEWESLGAHTPIFGVNNTFPLTSYIVQKLFGKFLRGSIMIEEGVVLNIDSDVLHSGLNSCPGIWNSSLLQSSPLFNETSGFGNCRNQSLARAIEDLSRNFTYSLMTLRHGGRPVSSTTVPVIVTAPQNMYSYNKSTLLATYAASILVVLFWMGVGAMTLWSNGTVSSTSFSSILLTTRNTDLDRLAKGYSLGSDALPDEIAGVRLRFGRVKSEGLTEHAAFGTEGTVAALRKGDVVF